MKPSQKKKQSRKPKDILRGIVNEIGELRNAVKLEEDMEILKEDLEDNINDVYWLAALFTNGNGVVFEEVIAKIAEKNKKRLPAKKKRK